MRQIISSQEPRRFSLCDVPFSIWPGSLPWNGPGAPLPRSRRLFRGPLWFFSQRRWSSCSLPRSPEVAW